MGDVLGQGVPPDSYTCSTSFSLSTELLNCKWKQGRLGSLLNKMSSSFPKVQSKIEAAAQPKRETSALSSEDDVSRDHVLVQSSTEPCRHPSTPVRVCEMLGSFHLSTGSMKQCPGQAAPDTGQGFSPH